MKSKLIVLGLLALLLAVVAPPQVVGRASAVPAAPAAGSVQAHAAIFDKTRFLLHVGLAYYAFHHFVYKRYKEGGPAALGDQRVHNGTKPTILTPEALAALKQRIRTPPDDGGLWTGPKIARWLAKFHGLKSVHDQRGWDALIAIGYSIQQPRPPRSGANIRARRSRSGRWTNTVSA